MKRKYPDLRPQSILVVGLSLMLLSSGCSANQSEAKNATNKEVIGVEKKPTTIPIAEMTTMSKQQQILLARQDLASRLELKLDDVSLSGATPVRWRSGALGCPKPGMQYTEALVSGVLIMLRVGNTAYRYHAIPTGEPFHCPDSQAEAPYMNTSDT